MGSYVTLLGEYELYERSIIPFTILSTLIINEYTFFLIISLFSALQIVHESFVCELCELCSQCLYPWSLRNDSRLMPPADCQTANRCFVLFFLFAEFCII